MKKVYILFAAFLISITYGQAQETRTFMFVGEPNTAAWKFLMENPQDRKETVAQSFKDIGGKIIGYYFGLGDGKNYIICELPNDNELIQAVYLMRLPSGLLASYQITELMPSDQMIKALEKSKELIKKEKQTSGRGPDDN
ncbi:MAG: GYD domain-containing protein [Flavobacteriaceae bacterium]|jgi:uncharacterized protein with GYD domain|nr:GYD domain-containing protein [Flavobacteriaceae bacterium]